MKTVFNFDSFTGKFIGLHQLDEGDLDPLEPGRYILPANCTESEPPPFAPGHAAYWRASEWVIEKLPEPEPEPGGEPPTDPTEPPFTEDPVTVLTAGIQEYMDAMARSRRYDSLTTAITYADEPAVPKFQKEGRYFRMWRSLVWAACYDFLAEVEAGTKTLPTLEEAIALLPPLEIDKPEDLGEPEAEEPA